MELWISNNTKDTNLEYRRFDTAFHSPPELKPQLLAGFSNLCQVSHEPRHTETKQLVVYEANSFTLAIFVHISWGGSKRLQLELSHDKVHLGERGDLGATFSRMSEMLSPPDPESTAVTRCELHGKGKASTWLFAGPYKLMATLSYPADFILKVQLEEQEMK